MSSRAGAFNASTHEYSRSRIEDFQTSGFRSVRDALLHCESMFFYCVRSFYLRSEIQHVSILIKQISIIHHYMIDLYFSTTYDMIDVFFYYL